MKFSDKFLDNILDEYFGYLQDFNDEDGYPMSYEAFEWLKIREIEEDRAELKLCDL